MQFSIVLCTTPEGWFLTIGEEGGTSCGMVVVFVGGGINFKHEDWIGCFFDLAFACVIARQVSLCDWNYRLCGSCFRCFFGFGFLLGGFLWFCCVAAFVFVGPQNVK